ncbi:M23 family metallopeptidase, partial [Candidatus Woesebacteria bacterium]|nr:M23 family metallopeptidase [Candidatus Woesebacteria bacterium]
SKIEVKVGQEVSITTEVGKLGKTGRASGDHLHLEIRDHGIPINPFSVLPR